MEYPGHLLEFSTVHCTWYSQEPGRGKCVLRNSFYNLIWWLVSVIPATDSLGQHDYYEFKTTLGYNEILSQAKQIKKTTHRHITTKILKFYPILHT